MRLLITGGAGFIGSNAAAFFLRCGHDVVVFDNCSRPNVDKNIEWLRAADVSHKLAIRYGDIRDQQALETLFEEAGPFDGVLHLAAQVAVTTSVQDPRTDFDINAGGTFNLLEVSRRQRQHLPVVVYASTNKVYGKLAHLNVVQRGDHYEYDGAPQGVGEHEPLDFYSPYGCSKGAADQYVRDYARIYGLPTIVVRQSCIYGPRQFGMEDQGWVAWFTIAAVSGRPITIYGNGRQARDLLWIDDLLLAYDAAFSVARDRPGTIYNIGGGPTTVASLLEVLRMLEERLGTSIPRSFRDWRPGDQELFVADIRKAQRELNWTPKVLPGDGVPRLLRWVQDNAALFSGLVAAR